MGCDIHIEMEVRNENTGKWRNVSHSICDDRNYMLFGILANVRNMDNMIPISNPRGLPEDAAVNYSDEYDNYDIGDHSFSYLTFEEILNYNWEMECSTTRAIFSGGITIYKCSEIAESFLDSIMRELNAYGKNAKDMRIVFGFDS